MEEQYAHLKSDSINNDNYLPGGPITNDDVKNVIKQLKRRKAPGDDGITNEHIIFEEKDVVSILTKVFNSLIKCGRIPALWKRGLIVPLYKGSGKPKNSCNSYRPVALLPCMFKIFEKVILHV